MTPELPFFLRLGRLVNITGVSQLVVGTAWLCVALRGIIAGTGDPTGMFNLLVCAAPVVVVFSVSTWWQEWAKPLLAKDDPAGAARKLGGTAPALVGDDAWIATVSLAPATTPYQLLPAEPDDEFRFAPIREQIDKAVRQGRTVTFPAPYRVRLGAILRAHPKFHLTVLILLGVGSLISTASGVPMLGVTLFAIGLTLFDCAVRHTVWTNLTASLKVVPVDWSPAKLRVWRHKTRTDALANAGR